MENNYYLLALKIADYLTDSRGIEKAKAQIEEYGVEFDVSSKELVQNAVRHLKYEVNPFNRETITEILKELDFTEEEISMLRY